MSFHPDIFPPIPEDTARLAGSLFGKGNVYIRVGEQINHFFSKPGSVVIDDQDDRSRDRFYLYAVVTAFQYAEGLTDYQMVEAIRSRLDLKYALHLPMNYPNLSPEILREFRQHLYSDSVRQIFFQTLLERLRELGLLRSATDQTPDVKSVLDEICFSSRLEKVLESMYEALESLALSHPDWLRHLALPHWYQRYSRKTQKPLWPGRNPEWMELSLQIASDIKYLLGEIDRSSLKQITSLPQVQELRRVWQEHFEVSYDEASLNSRVHWKPHVFAFGCT